MRKRNDSPWLADPAADAAPAPDGEALMELDAATRRAPAAADYCRLLVADPANPKVVERRREASERWFAADVELQRAAKP